MLLSSGYETEECYDGWVVTRKDRIKWNYKSMREKAGLMPIVEKIVESLLRSLDIYGEDHIDQMDDSSIVRDRGRRRKTIGQIIKRDLDLNSLSSYMIHDRTLWSCLIDVANPNYWEKALVVVQLKNIVLQEGVDGNKVTRKEVSK